MVFLLELFNTILSRRTADAATSYVARLLHDGTSAIARKVGEEAIETILAAAAGNKKETINESADLLFHLLVLWADSGITPDEVVAELKRRQGTSGLAEKAARKE